MHTPEPQSLSVHLPPRIDAPFGGCTHPQRVPYGLVEKHKKLVRTESLFENENNGVGGGDAIIDDTGSQEGRTWSQTDGTHLQYPSLDTHPDTDRATKRERASEKQRGRDRHTQMADSQSIQTLPRIYMWSAATAKNSRR